MVQSTREVKTEIGSTGTKSRMTYAADYKILIPENPKKDNLFHQLRKKRL
jgi:hypothetical protein